MPRLSADARHRIRLKLNGRTVEADAEPRMLLTDFLRQSGDDRHPCRL
jgi:2-furoyl-CoA dehydrogenase 2Fe-2S iron sulfur subunit